MIRNRMAAQDAEGISASLANGLEAMRRHGKCVTCNALLLPEVIRASLFLDKLEVAETSLAKLNEISEKFDSHVWTAMACQAEGRVRRHKGDFESAAQAFEHARRDFLAVEQPYEAARSTLLLAKSVRECARPKEADKLLGEARDMFRDLGAPGTEDAS